jgi:RNA polymerase sigma factor (sigma-70 family)
VSAIEPSGGPAVPGDALREVAPHVLGALVRRFGDFAAAEDAVQEALLAAHVTWSADGVPANPGGWLYRVACRKYLDALDSEDARRRREEHVAQERAESQDDGEVGAHHDDTLELLFLCCHPALSPAAAIALTLRAVGGLVTAEIARAFFVPEATMAQRIVRAKWTLAEHAASLGEIAKEERERRLSSVLHVLYLLFNEGYLASSGESLVRADLSGEAIRLTRALHRARADDAEVGALLALMLLTDARRDARTGAGGELVPLHEQDRTLWDRAAIAEGLSLVSDVFARRAVGPYALQAAIAALHDVAPSVEATDWPQVLALHDALLVHVDHPLVALGRVVALAMVEGPERALAELGPVADDARLSASPRVPAVRAHLLELAGRAPEAIASYREAAARTTSLPERRYLVARAGKLDAMGRE